MILNRVIKHFTIYVLIIISSVIRIYGQTVESLNTFSPVSIQAFSQGNVSNTAKNIDLYTGKLNYGISLQNLTINGIFFLIGVTYSTIGFKVQEVPSNVGLGWSLNVKR